jgi:hypothetical protein
MSLLACTAVGAQSKLDSVIVYGDHFIFIAKVPDGWLADTEHAEVYHANALFYLIGSRWDNPEGVIRVRVGNKTDEKTDEDLAADMEGYKKQYPGVQFKDITTPHPKYHVYPKLFFVPNDFYEYVAYVNPGPQFPFLFSVSMNIAKKEATKDELTAFTRVISSLEMMSAPQSQIPRDTATSHRGAARRYG